jgi:hypothetical protein
MSFDIEASSSHGDFGVVDAYLKDPATAATQSEVHCMIRTAFLDPKSGSSPLFTFHDSNVIARHTGHEGCAIPSLIQPLVSRIHSKLCTLQQRMLLFKQFTDHCTFGPDDCRAVIVHHAAPWPVLRMPRRQILLHGGSQSTMHDAFIMPPP